LVDADAAFWNIERGGSCGETLEIMLLEPPSGLV